MLTKQIEKAQKKVEEQNFLIRKRVLEYDDVMNEQRRIVYAYRDQILEGEAMGEAAREKLEDVIRRLVDEYTPGDFIEEWDLGGLHSAIQDLWPTEIDIASMKAEQIDREELVRLIHEDAVQLYDEREQELGEELMRALERYLLLQIIDTQWREHLYDMDYLREGIHLRGFAQIDPLVAYKNEAYDLFTELMTGIWTRFAQMIFNVDVEIEGGNGDGGAAAVPPPRPRDRLLDRPQPRHLLRRRRHRRSRARWPPRPALRAWPPEGMTDEGGEPLIPVVEQRRVTDEEQIGRNDPCWCGSGKKFKKCHGAVALVAAVLAAAARPAGRGPRGPAGQRQPRERAADRGAGHRRRHDRRGDAGAGRELGLRDRARLRLVPLHRAAHRAPDHRGRGQRRPRRGPRGLPLPPLGGQPARLRQHGPPRPRLRRRQRHPQPGLPHPRGAPGRLRRRHLPAHDPVRPPARDAARRAPSRRRGDRQPPARRRPERRLLRPPARRRHLPLQPRERLVHAALAVPARDLDVRAAPRRPRGVRRLPALHAAGRAGRHLQPAGRGLERPRGDALPPDVRPRPLRRHRARGGSSATTRASAGASTAPASTSSTSTASTSRAAATSSSASTPTRTSASRSSPPAASASGRAPTA